MSSTTTTQVETPPLSPVVPLLSSSTLPPRPAPTTYQSELPYPSPSVEDISGFPRINTGYVAETTTEDPDLDVAAYPYPNSTNDSKLSQTSYSNESPRPDSRRTRTISDPFAAHREGTGMERNPFTFEARDRSGNENGDGEDGEEGPRPERACDKTERRLSDDSGVYFHHFPPFQIPQDNK